MFTPPASIDLVHILKEKLVPKISLTPSNAFTIAPGHAPNAVRLALGLPTHPQLRTAGDRLAQLLATDPDEADVTE
jgi:DNA-binding transcriptional MocR family regulator